MNREIETLLKEKWFLVAADLIAVLGILLVMPEKRDGLDTFIIICAILAASLIVVIPVLRDGGGKAERQAEQARLRARLAEEIDLQRDNIRAGQEIFNRRLAEAETTARKAADSAAAAVAQRASAEVNALKAALAALQDRLLAVEDRGRPEDALEEIAAKIEGLAVTVRSLVATTEESAEDAVRAREEAGQTLADEIKGLRDEIRKSAKLAEKNLAQVADDLAAVRAKAAIVPAAPAAPIGQVPAATEEAAEEDEAEEEAAEEEEEAEEVEIIAATAAPPAPSARDAESGRGTALIVNLMIGIGNKPFVRGTGAGLSPDKGVPMSFLGIGRWQWVSADPEAPATVSIWKNDQSPMGEPLHLSGGETVEVDEGHFGGA